MWSASRFLPRLIPILIFINDLPFPLQRTKVTMYADDARISYSSRSVTDFTNAINSDLQDLSIWLQGNKLTLNVVKTQSMIFGNEPNLRRIYRDTSTSFPLFQINLDKIESTDHIKYLRLKINPSLNWKEQITITSKISRLTVRSHEEQKCFFHCNTSTNLEIPLYKASKGQHSYSNRGVALWNQLSHEKKLLLR